MNELRRELIELIERVDQWAETQDASQDYLGDYAEPEYHDDLRALRESMEKAAAQLKAIGF